MTKKRVAIVTADTHLAPRAWAKHPGLAGDSYYGLKQVVDYAVDNYLPVILAGDVFDKTRPDPSSVHHMRWAIDRFQEHDISLYYIQGQHELDREDPWIYALSNWPTWLDRELEELPGGINIYGLDWYPSDVIQARLAQIPKQTDVFIAHQVWREFLPYGDAECSFSDVPNAKIIFTGDFHRHLHLHFLNRDGKNISVLSPGPVAMQSIDENPQKFFFVLYDDLSVEAHSLRTRDVYRYVLTDKDSLEKFLSELERPLTPQSKVPENIATNIIHVSYEDSIPEAYNRITNAVGDKAHLFLVPKRKRAEVVNVDVEARRKMVEDGLVGCLPLVTEPGSRLHRDLHALLLSEEPHELLERMHGRYLAEGLQEKQNDSGLLRDDQAQQG